MGKYSEIIAATQAEDDKLKVRAATITAPPVDPDSMGRAMAVADKRGLPPGVVAGNLGEYDREDQADAVSSAAGTSPVLARWLGDPNHVALAKDDTSMLSAIGTRLAAGLLSNAAVLPGARLPMQAANLLAAQPAPDADAVPQMSATPDPTWFSELVGKYQAGWQQGKAGNAITGLPDLASGDAASVEDIVARGFGLSGRIDSQAIATGAYVGDQMRRSAAADVESADTRRGFDEIAAADKRGNTGEILAAVGRNPKAIMAVVAQSLGATTPQLAASALMPASKVVRGIVAAGGSYTAEQGMTVLDVMQDSGVETSDPAAVSSFLRNKPAMDKARDKAMKRGIPIAVFDGLSAGFAGQLLANARRSMVSIGGRVAGEAGVQAGAGALGEAGAQLASEGRIKSQADIIMEAAAEMPTFLAEGRGHLAEARRNAIANGDRFDAEDERRALDDLVMMSAESKTRQRSAGRFESLIRDMTGEGEDTVYLSADGAQRLFQSASDAGLDLGDMVDPVALREAVATGGEVSIPLAKYAAAITPELHAVVRDQLRMQPGARHDLQDISEEEISEAIALGVEDARREQERDNGPAGQVYDEVYGQLLSRQDEKLARQNATVVQSVYRNLAERMGMDAWQLFQQFKVRIPGATTDRRAAPRGVDIDVDPYLDALRTGKLPTDREIYGDSFVSALHAAGGLRDSGGELANMDAAKLRPGLVNNLAGMSLDDALAWAYQEGFITQAPTNLQEGDYDGDAPDINTVLDMLAQDLGGHPVYRAGSMNPDRAAFRDSAMSLQEELDQRGVDLSQMDNAAARQALGYGERTLDQPAYHGTPHTVDRFSLQKIGTGEGAQAYGWGLYFAENREVADWYRKGLSGRELVRSFRQELPDDAEFDEVLSMAESGDFSPGLNDLVKALAVDDWLGFDYPAQAINAAVTSLKNFDASPELSVAVDRASGNLYQVETPDDNDLILYDKALRDSDASVVERLSPAIELLAADKKASATRRMNSEEARQSVLRMDAKAFYQDLANKLGGPRAASEYLGGLGVPGLKYLDGQSRNNDDGGSFNFVIWDEALVSEPVRLNQGAIGDSIIGARPKRSGAPSPPSTANPSEASLEENGYGRPSSIDQTETAEFKAWFGGSKIVDIGGNPLVLFHGTQTDMQLAIDSGSPLYLTNSPAYAAYYAAGEPGGSPMSFDGAEYPIGRWTPEQQAEALRGIDGELELLEQSAPTEQDIELYGQYRAIIPMLRTADREGMSPSGAALAERLMAIESSIESHTSREFALNDRRRVAASRNNVAAPNVSAVYAKVENPLRTDDELYIYNLATNKEEISNLQALGYDGVVWSPEGVEAPLDGTNRGLYGAEVLVLNPAKQVKSATANVGTFDPSNPSILFQSSRFPEDNRLSNLSPNGASWERIRDSNPALRGKGMDDEITIYRATIGDSIRPDDFVAVDSSTLDAELENVRDRDGDSAKVIQQRVRVRDLIMGNDATEFVYYPEPASAGAAQADPFRGMTRDEFLGNPKITPNSNASDLRPRAMRELDDIEAVPFGDGKLSAKYSDGSAAVFDGEKVVASYNFGTTLVVDKAYRRRGIGEELVYQWRTRNPQAVPARERTKASQALQEKVWNRIQRELETSLRSLNQGGEQPRGSVTLLGTPGAREFAIELTAGMDASTFMHEMGHVYLEVVNELSAREDAPQQIRDDMATLDKWLGRDAGAAFTVDQHEQFARGFEAYLREGRAPSSALRRVFASFKVWLTAIYRSARQLNVDLTDDVRNVMDRIIASDAEIEEARGAQYQGALIGDAMAVGMSFDDFMAYNEAVAAAQADAEASVVAEVLRAEQREQKAWYNQEKRRVRGEVQEELRQMPAYRAQRILRTGKLPDGEMAPEELRVKLSKEDLLDQFGQSFLRNLSGMYSASGGVSADTAAAMLGFGSGREMVDALVNAPRLMDAVASETDARMSVRYPDPMTDGSLPDRAMVAAHRDRQADVMLREVRALESHTGGRAVSQGRVIKGIAQGIIRQKRLRDLQPATYRSAEARAGREAFAAAAQQDWPAALAARRRQLLNFELFREALRARDDAARSAKYLAKFSETKVRARLGKAGGDYLDQVDGLLDRFDFRKITDKAADRRSSLATWISTQEANGIDVSIDPKLIDEAFTIPYREMTVDDLASLRDAVKAIDHLARLKGKLILAGELRDAAEIDAAMAGSVMSDREARPVTTGVRPKADAFRDAFLQGRILQGTATDLARELDGGKDQGPVWHNTVGVIRDAVYNRLNPALQESQDQLAEIYTRHYSKEEIRALQDRFPAAEVNGDLWTKSRVLSLALNWGNQGNREAVLSQAKGRMTPLQVGALLQRLDARDWAFVADVWGMIDSHWPAIAAAQKQRTGLVPEKVEPSPFSVTTADGRTMEIAGGYYPLKYDSDTVKSMGEEIDDYYKSITLGRQAKAATKKGHTIERVGSGGRTVSLELGLIQSHMRDVLRDIHLGDAVNYVSAVLKGKEFREAIADVGLLEYHKALDVWLHDVAAGEIGPRVWSERAGRAFRQNFTASVLTWKATTAMLQVSGIIPAGVLLGNGNMMAGVQQFLAHPKKSYDYVRASSSFMDARLRTHIEAVQVVMDAEAGRFMAGKAAMIRFGYWAISRVQGLVDTVTWLAAERVGMIKFGGDVAQARAFADDSVTRAQGSGEFIDKSMLQRGTFGDNVRQSEWVKATTALQGYMIAKGNLAYARTRETRFSDPAQAARWAMDMVMLFSIEGIITALIQGKLPGGGDDEDGDGMLDEWLKFLAGDATQSIVGVIPGGGSVVSSIKGFDTGGVLSSAWKAYGELASQVADGEMDKGLVRAAIGTAGVTLGIPSLQIQKTVDAIAARADGHDVSPYEYLTGPTKEHKK